ncbi:MAG: phospho-N-acetylmuramoyl-pentapeptide-transferase [Calditrichia bacterium]
MLADLLYQLKDFYFGFNVFRYITVRAALAAITALLFSLFIGPKIISLLQRYQIGEKIREDGPKTHLQKAGTPTMGGIIILAGVVIGALLWAKVNNFYIQMVFIATVWMGFVGFVDDYLKAVKKMKKGLVARYKLIGQIALGFFIGSMIYFNPHFVIQDINSNTSVPFLKNVEIDFGILYIVFVTLMITGFSNAVNLTDGLDGLATGLVAIAALVFAGISYVTGNVKFSDYLNIIYLSGSGELTVYCLALLGGALGFLWYNSYPAQVFMGDTGALALGSTLGTLAVLLKKEILLLLVGGIFVAEAASVIIQTTYFKYTRKKYGEGKRVFKMAPLHHHFELKGWHEAKVVTRFWIIGILLALLTLTTFKIR